jgi:hypothetical protein
MDHQEATRRGAVEKYLLNELAPPERDEFEEHFFDCQECAADLSTTAAFLDEAKRELKRSPGARPAPRIVKKSPFAFFWRPAFAAPAWLLLVLVIGYQNAVVYPRLSGDLAQLNRPEVLASVSLIGANSRGGAVPSVTIRPGQSILLSVDIPAAEQFSSYACALIAPSGARLWQLPVSAEQAKDTVSMRIPAGHWQDGEYRLTVEGHADRAGAEPAELARYRFTLHLSN